MNIPNLITLLRLLLAPVVIWLLLEHEPGWAFGLFIFAGITDALDGMIAKRLGQITEIGAFLDPIADKVLLAGIFITLGVMHEIPAWLVLLTVSRDVLIVGGVLLLYTLDVKVSMQPLMVSKLNTVVQIVLVGMVLGGMNMPQFEILSSLISYTIWLAALTTSISGGAYILAWLKTATAGAAEGAGK